MPACRCGYGSCGKENDIKHIKDPLWVRIRNSDNHLIEAKANLAAEPGAFGTFSKEIQLDQSESGKSIGKKKYELPV